MKIKKLNSKAIPPHYATEGASCFDIFCYEKPEWITEKGNWVTTIKTGWAVEIPHEHALMLYSRSGHGFNHHTKLINGTGVIDFDYKPFCKEKHSNKNGDCKHFKRIVMGKKCNCLECEHYYKAEVMIKLICHATSYPQIKAGEAVAQGCIVNTPRTYFMEVEELSETVRGEKGIGSTTK